MKEHVIQTFQFDELSDTAKDAAREWWRQFLAEDAWWSESVIEDAARIAECFGLELKQEPVQLVSGKTRYEPAILWSGFWSQGDGACFEGTLKPRADAVKALAEYANESELEAIAVQVAEAHRLTKGLLVAVIRHHGNYSHEYSMEFDFEYPEEDSDDPEVMPNTVLAKLDVAERLATEAMQSFARWIYRSLEKEYEYQNADEQIDDSILANEYEFTEDGERFVL